jgi:glutamyl-tRNA reductase
MEQVALTSAAARLLEADLCRADHVAEAFVLATCNRVEVYAEVSKFHGGVADIGSTLSRAGGIGLPELTEHLYVHYEDAAVLHLFTVTCGLDSMAVGEQQVIAQVREALTGARASGAAGRVLGRLGEHALRVGKRAHTETGLDRAGHGLVEAGLARAAEVLGPLPDRRVLVVGAGAMSGLVVATVRRAGVPSLTIANRTAERAARLARGGRADVVDLAHLPDALVAADLVVSSTGAVGYLLTADVVRAARARRGGAPQVYVDLALPRDVEPGVAAIEGVTLVDLEELGRVLASSGIAGEVEDAREIIAEEVAAYLSAQRAEAVAPTVVALRAHARSVVDAEMRRLEARLGETDPRVRQEVTRSVNRVVEKLLHTPTVRVKELAEEPGGSSYADALRELFDLDLERVAAVSGLPAEQVGGAP